MGQDEHGHVAAHPVATVRHPVQFGLHGFLQCRIAVVELEGVGPAVEVGVAAVRQHGVLDPAVVLGLASQVFLRARDVVLRVLADPGVVGSGVVGDEVQDQLQAARIQAPAQTLEGLVSTELLQPPYSR